LIVDDHDPGPPPSPEPSIVSTKLAASMPEAAETSHELRTTNAAPGDAAPSARSYAGQHCSASVRVQRRRLVDSPYGPLLVPSNT
jgi:hypothetical protein